MVGYRSFFLIASTALLAAGCSGGPAKHATEGVGPVSVEARNKLAAANPEGLVRVGEGFERAGDYAGAIALYEQALAAAPELLSARIALARVLVPLGKVDAAVAQLSNLLETHPQSSEVRAELVEALIADGAYARASEVFSPIVTPAAGPDILDLAGRLAFVAGDRDTARQHFDASLRQNPNHGDTMNHLALSYAIEGEFEAAVAILRKAMDNPLVQLQAQRTLAGIYALSGQKDAALHIARGAMTTEEANNLRSFFELLPRLNAQEQAEALMFDRIPKSAIERLQRP
jgi:Flp pilus assembly protein TadD